MSETCVFCKIAKGEIPSQIVYEDDRVVAFYDINPQTPVHVLVIPRHHYASLDSFTLDDRDMAGYLLERTAHVARELGLVENGYRVSTNVGAFGGQEVFHIHVHILGGRPIGPLASRR
ncbi:MAG: histidine triad nucleotide-binding protein [Magnetococcales bacterium]|nr:histidine triad nucleotide-binding protein [Magnetococcales bacterium]MBF0321957.1 histidine triad nucleotide-binding protein [Magnetococcales bacterium]